MINDNRLVIKEKFLEYYADLPIQKLAAHFAGISENTVLNWKKEDKDFCDQINSAKSQWARINSKKVRSKEWLLERIFRKTFAPPKQDMSLKGEIDHIIISREPKR